MRALILVACAILVPACQSVPGVDPAAAACAGQIAQLHSEIQMLVSVFATAQQATAVAQAPAADTIELEARLGALTDRFDDLLARLPAPAGAPPRAVEASSRMRSASDSACITALRDAIAVVDRAQQVVVENIANVNTVGYKKRALVVTSEVDARTGLALPQGHGVQAVFTTGALEITERQLDIAIDGDGFFAVALPDGSTGYTRDGRFHINADGKVVTGDGGVVVPEITVPDDTLEISFDPCGRVSGRTAGSPDTATSFGQLTLTRYVNPASLSCDRGTVLRPTGESGAPCTGEPGTQGLGLLKQGFLERSNVQLLNESVDLQLWRRQRTELRRALAGFGVFVP